MTRLRPHGAFLRDTMRATGVLILLWLCSFGALAAEDSPASEKAIAFSARANDPKTEAASSFSLKAMSQGCADQGLCYPPMSSRATISWAGFGGDGRVTQVASGGTVAASGEPIVGFSAAKTAQPTFAVNTASYTDISRIEQALQSGRFWIVVVVFFVAGLLLSLTPCVLPMLPILSSIIVGERRIVRRGHGLLMASSYSLGMALFYTGLGIAAGLAGEGLAAVLQTPWVLVSFAGLLVLLSLSMFGVYNLQLPHAISSRVAHASQRLPGGQVAAVFAMGAISALIVSPCVAAPLAGALVFLSQTRNVPLGGSALFALSVGMSVPLLLLGASAGALLPRAGPWMKGVKQFFGLLLIGVAVWMLQPILNAPVKMIAWGSLLLFAALLLRPFGALGTRPNLSGWLRRFAGVATATLGLLQIVGAASGSTDPLRPLAHWSADSKAHEALPFRRIRNLADLDAALQSAGRPVMLDFYADWCVSCKEMERFTFSRPEVQARLEQALLLQADVTANSKEERELLRRFGLFGPPGIVFFDAEGREITGTRVIGFQDAERFARSLSAAGL